MQRAGGNLVTRQAAHADALGLQKAARHFDEGEAAPFPRRRRQAVLAGLIAVQKRLLHGRAAGFHLVLTRHTHMRTGFGGAVAGGGGVAQRGAGLCQRNATGRGRCGSRPC